MPFFFYEFELYTERKGFERLFDILFRLRVASCRPA
jgi:hypothetical protein